MKEEEKSEPQESNDLSQIERKRQKGKIRAKRSRDRKKRYLEELECRIKDLEKENIKLTQIIHQLKIEKFQQLGPEHWKSIDHIEKIREMMTSKFLKKDQNGNFVPTKENLLKEIFNKQVTKNFQNLLDNISTSFSYICQCIFPPQFGKHMKALNKPITMSLDELNSFK